MRIRRSLSIFGIAATALMGVALASGTASASSGGGCGIAFEGGITACISASGNQVNYDIYVPSIPPGCEDIALTILDDDSRKGDTPHVGCRTGHFSFSVAGINGHRYHSFATVWIPSGPVVSPPSPELVFSD
ncbi:MAG TPA: hypothetical protein VNO21_04155 [Polyangiaceae bacterium]|nr:hypothetical protein [Polyangiaceae bacterium]